MKKLEGKKEIGVFQVMAGAIMISFSPVFVKIANTGPAVTGFYRMLFGGVILLAVLKVLKGRLWQGRTHFFLAVACSAIFTLDIVLWHKSILYVGPGLATILSNFQIFFLIGFSAFILKERITPKLLISVFIAAAGLYLIVGIDWHTLEPQHKIGVLFGLITALCYAAYVLILRKMQPGEGLLSLSNISTLAMITLVNLLFMAVASYFSKESFSIPDRQSWLALLGYGLFSQALAWILICAGLSKISPATVGLILIFQPVLAFIWDIIFFSRHTPNIEIAGAFIAIGGIYLGTKQSKGRLS